MKKREGGYVGLVVILLATVILIFLYVRTYLSPTRAQVVTETGSIETTTTATRVEANQANLDTARALQEEMNQQNQDINKALGE